MKEIRTEDAVGSVLCHDITQIIKGEKKGPVFRKGHIVREEDIPVLLSVGKEHLYVWEKQEGMLHEDEAAAILRDLCEGVHMESTEAKEGKIEILAKCDGLLKINSEALYAVNSTPEMMVATRHGDTVVHAGDKLAGTRIIPLVIQEEKMRALRDKVGRVTGGKAILTLKKFKAKKVGIVTTGSEVYKGLIRDTFTPVLLEKLKPYETELVGHEICDDDPEMTRAAIQRMMEAGADLVLCTGGMSVDPDDKTPLAIRSTGARIVTYGAPVLPGAMFLLAYGQGPASQGKKPVVICGLPGCVMYAGRTIFDLVLPRIMADDPIEAKDFYQMGEGGLCLGCDVCTYPNCGFGK